MFTYELAQLRSLDILRAAENDRRARQAALVRRAARREAARRAAREEAESRRSGHPGRRRSPHAA